VAAAVAGEGDGCCERVAAADRVLGASVGRDELDQQDVLRRRNRVGTRVGREEAG
jgi:hypothetical protein